MRLLIFGLSISSSWGNGHATLWRGLCRALGRMGHHVIFFEHDQPYYAANRDLAELPDGELVLYSSWEEIRPRCARALEEADAAIVTSYCPDGVAATELVLSSRVPLRVFYDLDTPATLERLERGLDVPYIGPGGLAGFDLVLSYTGGKALVELCGRLRARRVAPLYGSVDPAEHHPVPPEERYRADLSYLGTYAEDRQAALAALFIEPARRLPGRRFLLGGSLYPASFPWTPNLFYLPHVPPPAHNAFYCSSPLTLSVTRGAFARLGHCPSGRLFEAAACGVPVLSDPFDGLERFFRPGEEILVAHNTEEAIAALELPRDQLRRIGRAARERALAEHTAERRARQMIDLFEASARGAAPDRDTREAARRGAREQAVARGRDSGPRPARAQRSPRGQA